MRIEDPFERIERFRRELEKLFDRNLREIDILRSGIEVPRVNIKEAKNKYELEIAIPGMRKEDIEVNIIGNRLVVKGERKEEKKEEKEGYLHQEWGVRKVYREIPLPFDVDVKSVEAKYENGVLRLKFKKVKEGVERVKID